MRAVLQRVTQARVEVEGKIVGQIGRGVLVYLGVGRADTEAQAIWIAEKIVHLRLFADTAGKMNLALADVGGDVLLVSQFTLYGDCRKGRRPSFDEAAEPELGRLLYQIVAELLRGAGLRVETGIFGANMAVTSVNDGPVTFLLQKEE